MINKLFVYHIIIIIIFTPIAEETYETWGPEALDFVSDLSKRLATATGDPRYSAFLKQRVSFAVQRSNAIERATGLILLK